MDWIHPAQDGDQWQALVNMINELQDPIKCWEILE
jgi:hypothetical protein